MASPTTTTALDIRGLTVSYRAAPVLWEVDAT
ncbi:MAG: manganese ABC transporter ATP-binding protein, partial [Pseudonocardia sp.]|nr:manganese ABC transporter ATP-binding protein [Pseudonocardia sp.]